MSYLNPDELKENEVDYIQDLYYKLHSELQHSISCIYELANQDSIGHSDNSIGHSDNFIRIKPLIEKYLYNNNQKRDVSNDGFIKFRTLIREEVFKIFYDIIKPIHLEKHHTKINKKIIITDLYAFLPLITNLIIYYSTISEGLYIVCHEFIEQITRYNFIKPTNEMIINSLYSFKLSIALLHELLNFIKTREIISNKQIDDNIVTYLPEYSYSNFKKYLSKLKNIVSSFDTNKDYIIKIKINDYNKYLQDYINKSTATFITVDSPYKFTNFIKHIETSLTTYLVSITNIDLTILKRLFDAINNIKIIYHNKLIELLEKIITSIEIINSKLFNNNNTEKYRYKYILYGINIIILLKKFIEYLYTDEYIIIYTIINVEEVKKIDAFLPYIDYQIYPNYKLKTENISIINDINIFLQKINLNDTLPLKKVKLDKPQESNTPVIFTDPNKPETIKLFIEELKIYVLAFFYDVLKDNIVKKNINLNKILYEYKINKKYNDISFIKNITSLFTIILYKISNTEKINDSIKYLLQYIINLTINICIILAKNGTVNKYLLKGIVNIILLNKLKDYFEAKTTTITYSNYYYRNIKNDISMDDVMKFIIDNNLEYDLDSNIIEFSKIITEEEIYSNIDTIIISINEQYNYSNENVTVRGGSLNNKYKKTENKITVIYKKKEYKRVIYICERKKYIKLNKTYMLLSKLKKV